MRHSNWQFSFHYWMLMRRNAEWNATPIKSLVVFFLNASVPSPQGMCVLASKDTAEISSNTVILPITGRRAKVRLPVTQENPSFRASLPLWASWLLGFLLTPRLFPECIRCASPRHACIMCRNPTDLQKQWVSLCLSVGPAHLKQEQRTLRTWWGYQGHSSACKLVCQTFK